MIDSLSNRDRKSKAAWWLLPALLAALLYLGTLQGDFVYDDVMIVKDNPLLRSWSSIPDLFTAPGDPTKRPLLHLTLLIDYQLHGPTPWGFHLTNLILHVICTLLVAALSHRWSGSKSVGLIAGVFFAAHPVHVDAVASIAHRKDPLAAAFVLTALLLYSYSAKRRGLLILAVVAHLMALLSKEMIGLSLLLLLPLADFIESKDRTISFRWKSWLPFALITVVTLVYGLTALDHPGGSSIHLSIPANLDTLPPGHAQYLDGSYPVIILTAVRAFGEYVRLLVFPFPLRADYDLAYVSSPLEPGFLLASALFIALLLLMFYLRRRGRSVVAGLAFMMLSYLPASNLLPITFFVAERYLYLPSAGFCFALGVAAMLLWKKADHSRTLRILFASAGAVILGLCCLWTVLRSQVWNDSISLWTDTVQRSPRSFIARNNLGRALIEQGRDAEAEKQLTAALSLQPGLTLARGNLGALLVRKGRIGEGIEHLTLAAREDPSSVSVRSNLAVALGGVGRLKESKSIFDSLIQEVKDDPVLYLNRGNIRFDLGDFSGAAEDYRRCITLSPDSGDAWEYLAQSLLQIAASIPDVDRRETLLDEASQALNQARRLLVHDPSALSRIQNWERIRRELSQS